MKYLTAVLFIILFLIDSRSQHFNVQVNKLSGNKSYNTKYVGTDASGNVFTKSNKIKFGKLKPWGKTFMPYGTKMLAESSLLKNKSQTSNYEFIDFVFENNHPLILFKKINKSNDDLFAIETNHKFEWIGNPFLVGSFSECNEFFLEENSVGERTFISRVDCNRNDSLRLRRVSLTDQNMVFHDYEFSLAVQENIKDLTIFTASTEVFIAFNTKSFYGSSYLFKVDNFGNAERLEIPLDNEELEISDIQIKKKNKNIYVSGQLRNKLTAELKGVFTSTIDKGKGVINAVNLYLFKEEFIASFSNAIQIPIPEKNTEIFEQNYSYKIVDRIVTDNDHTIYFIQKRYAQTLKVFHERNTSPPYLKQNYYYADLLVLRMDPDAKPLWVRSMPLFHKFENYDPQSCFKTLHKEGKLYIIHSGSEELKNAINSEEDYIISPSSKIKSNYLMITEIRENGKVESNILLNLKEKDIQFNPERIGVDNINKNFLMFNSKRRLLFKNKIEIFSISI